MTRRDFLAAVAMGVPASGAQYTSYARYLGPDSDEFACEREAQKIESELKRLLATKSLPLSPQFHGRSPLPSGFEDVAGGVSEAVYDSPDLSAEGWRAALRKWIDSLGKVRASRFFALADNVVRYEIASEGEYRVGHWKQIWHENKLVKFLPIDEAITRAPASLFQDVTAHCFGELASFRNQLLGGNPWWRARLDAATGIDVYANNGIAVGDIDNDGQDEIYVCQQGGLPNRLYKNRGGGVFEDITERSGLDVLDDTTCALFVDFRNSGVQDLVVLRGSGPLLFRNDGKGRFTHQADAFRFGSVPQGGFTGMAAADYDRDGKVDLYLCCYVYFQSEDQYRYPKPYHDAQNGPPNFLFRNRGEWFEDVTAEVGLNHNNNRYSFAPAWCDFDGDGWPDLYVANDFGRNNLYRNRDGKFRDEAAEAGVEDMAPGMSAAWFDYDGDGRPDLYVSNMWTAPGQRITHDPAFRLAMESYKGHTKGNSLYRNRGDGTFEAVEMAQGVAMGRWAWSADAFDFDNDGTPEIYIAAGMLTNKSEADLGSFFWRQVVSKSGEDYENGWNALNELIREDYSWCGREPNVFYRRPKGAARFYDFSGVSGLDFADDTRAFSVTDVDGDGNLDIILKNRLGPQIRVMRNNCGTGRGVAAFRLHGTKSNRDAIGARVEVDGRAQFVSAGSGFLSQHTKTLHFATPVAARVKITWPSGADDTHEGIEPGYIYDITEGSTELKREPFRSRRNWSTAPVTPRNGPEPADVTLLEPVPTPDPVKPGILVIQPGELSLLRRYLLEYRAEPKIPVALLVDNQSRIRKLCVYSKDASGTALPFPGKYYRQPQRNYFKLGAAFYWAGMPDRALPYLKEELQRNAANWKALNAVARIELDRGRHQEALDAFRGVLLVRPDYSPALLGAGEAAMQLNQLADAEKYFGSASGPDAANQMGLLKVRQNRPAEAKRWFESAIEKQRDHSGAINNLGVLYMQLGQASDAVAAFEFGIQQAPDDEQLYMNLGRVYVGLGQIERARDTMHRLLARKPGDAAATRALASLSSR
jgi:tetratricopeptide (TPR) repeat protein